MHICHAYLSERYSIMRIVCVDNWGIIMLKEQPLLCSLFCQNFMYWLCYTFIFVNCILVTDFVDTLLIVAGCYKFWMEQSSLIQNCETKGELQICLLIKNKMFRSVLYTTENKFCCLFMIVICVVVNYCLLLIQNEWNECLFWLNWLID